MAASSSDKASRSANGGIPAVGHVTAARSVGVNSISVDTQQYWPTATGIKFSTYKTTTVGTTLVKVAGSQTDWTGVSNGANTISNIVAVGGAGDVGNAIGDVVQMGPTSQWGDDIATFLLQEHNNPSGTHSNINTQSINNSGTLINSGLITANGGLTVPTGQVANVIPALSNPYKFSVYRNSAATFGTSVSTLIYDTKTFDTGSNYSTSTGQFTAPVNGFYFFDASFSVSSASNAGVTIFIYKNGAQFAAYQSPLVSAVQSNSSFGISKIMSLNANDTVQIEVNNSAGTLSINTGNLLTWFEGHIVSAT